MNTLLRWTTRKSICVVGANELAVSVGVVIASNCPNLDVNLANMDASELIRWGEKQIPSLQPDLEELLDKCLKENLCFATDIKDAVMAAEIIMLLIDDPDLDSTKYSAMSELEKVVRLIAQVSDTAKTIVQKSPNVPVGTCETLESIVNANKLKKLNFQILAMPEFFTSVSPVSYLLNPDFVFLGHENSPEGEKAAEVLVDVYTHWVPAEKIKKMTCKVAELSQLAINVILAQKLMAGGTIAAICEQAGKNFKEIMKILKVGNKSDANLNPGFGLENMNMYRGVLRLLKMCEQFRLKEVESYWKEVINLNENLENWFMKKILSAFYNSLNYKRLAIFGVSYKGNGKITSELPAVRLAAKILQEQAEIVLFDPKIQIVKEEMMEMLKRCGAKNAEGRVTVFDDPYKAAGNVHGIIFGTDSMDLKCLDFAALYKVMNKPALLFDGRNILEHENLSKIGFEIKAIGKECKS